MPDGKSRMIGAEKKERGGCANCKCSHGNKEPLGEGINKEGNGSRGTVKLDVEKLQRRALAEMQHERLDIMLANQLAPEEGKGAKPVPWKPWVAPENGDKRGRGTVKALPDDEIARIQARAFMGRHYY